MVTLAEEPCTIVSMVGAAMTLKSCVAADVTDLIAAGTTITVEPLVARSRIGVTPLEAPLGIDMVNVTVVGVPTEGVIEDEGVNVAVAPEGSPLTEKVTAEANVPTGFSVIEKLALPPAGTAIILGARKTRNVFEPDGVTVRGLNAILPLVAPVAFTG